MVSENKCGKEQKRMLRLKGITNDVEKKISRKKRTFDEMEERNQKRQFKRCNVTFWRKRIKVIKRVECRDNGVLIQVTSKAEVERVIMKENKKRFKLTRSSLMLNSDMCVDLGLLEEGSLTKEILGS